MLFDHIPELAVRSVLLRAEEIARGQVRETIVADELVALGSLAGAGAAEDVDHGDVGGGEGGSVFGGRGDLRFGRGGGDGRHWGGGGSGGADGVSFRFGGLAGARSDHQGVGAGAEEGDGDEGPDFEGGAAGVGVGAGPVGPGGRGNLEDGVSKA